MNKLSARTLKPNRPILTVILEQYGITKFSFTLFTQGIANTTVGINTDKENFVMRIYAEGRKADRQILHELAFQDALRENDVPVPLMRANSKGEELTIVMIQEKRWQVVLMEYVDGASKTLDHTPELIAELAAIQARMHVVGMQFPRQVELQDKSWDMLADYYAVHLEDLSLYPQNVQQFIDRAKDFAYVLNPLLPLGYNHLDLDLDGNVIVRDNRVRAIIDFDDLSYSPVAVCLGYSLWNVLHDENSKKMMEYLEQYQKIRCLEPDEYETILHVILFRNYEIGALRLYKTHDPSCIERPLEIEAEIAALIASK